MVDERIYLDVRVSLAGWRLEGPEVDSETGEETTPGSPSYEAFVAMNDAEGPERVAKLVELMHTTGDVRVRFIDADGADDHTAITPELGEKLVKLGELGEAFG